jgi:PPK2 family polyphosphate:nucleotide phosphotransferase
VRKHFAWKIEAGTTVKLKDYRPDFAGDRLSRDEAESELQVLTQELSKLQEVLYEAHHHSILIVLQGMDTSGKDGTVRHVLSNVNPQACYVQSFKEPTDEELAHDFLWRVHKATPGKGSMAIFNRSHYEDVLIARVHNLVPEEVWRKRYKEINHFENLLVNNNTLILKFFLHINYDEQTERLQARIQDTNKAWKISASDWSERKYWDEYQKAYEDVLTQCNEIPWYIVPANHKWYRNLAVAHILVTTMRTYKNEWKADLQERGKQELEKLKNLSTVMSDSTETTPK